MTSQLPISDGAHGSASKIRSVGQAKVVFLVNFLSPNLVEVMREVSRGVGKLDILVSVPMEANRNWQVDNRDLSVTLQKTWTRRKLAHHPGGYVEELFVHIPRDTRAQLVKLRPDCIVSLEMGMRSIQSSIFRCLWARKCRHVLAVYGSQRSEAGRGWLRRLSRRILLRAADVVTYNGPSCQRYLVAQGAPLRRMVPWNYAADPRKPYRGTLIPVPGRPLRMLSVGQLIARKGMDRACQSLMRWATEHPDARIEWSIAGTGPQSDWFRGLSLPDNFQIKLLGHCELETLQRLYAEHAIHFFPTLGDEWGLVVDEALHSGQIVIGSVHSQAVETLITTGENGWSFDPELPGSLEAVLERLLAMDDSKLWQMRHWARRSVADRTPEQSGQQFIAAVSAALDS